MKIIPFFLFLFLFVTTQSLAQLSGKITDTSGEELAFASVYVNGTSTGTTSNIEGIYDINLSPGTYEMVFQYVGYQQQVISVEMTAKPYQLDVQLKEESIDLMEVVVRANAEDPAYAIIRKAIEKREYYRDLIKAYSCDTYVKGNQKILDAPTKIMGQEIGDMEGTLDTNRQGIVYLSESQSKLYYQFPKKKKEVMISSKVSGDDNGFSFNRASMMDFSFYENTIDINRPLISPIANSAFSYYRYELVGTIYDEEQRLINKIKVIPKRENDPVFSGMIYIVEDTWNIQSTDLFVTGKGIQQQILDTLLLKQTHIPIGDESEKWVVLTQVIEFSGGIFGFKLKGNFTGIFSNYNLNPNFEDDFFSNEVFLVEENSNQKDSTYWEKIRPIPLTLEESVDYVKKDSLQVLWKSKPYLDSLDHENNKFKLINLLSGYSFNRSYRQKFFSIDSPVSAIQFNTIQGLVLNLDMDYRSVLDEDNYKWFELKPVLQYGLSDEKIRGQLGFVYNFNDTNSAQFSASAGKMLAQFNDYPPISGFLNSAYTLFAGENYLKAYDKTFANLKYRQELTNGVLLRTGLEYAQKESVVNTTDYSWAEETAFTWNNPLVRPNDSRFFSYSNLVLDLQFQFRINQKYLSYPNRKIIQGSPFPDVLLSYRKGFSLTGISSDFDLLRLGVKENYLSTGRLGYFSFFAEAGIFLNKPESLFPEYQHFNGNQTLFGNPNNYNNSFLRLPYYEYSTNDKYLQIHAEQYLSGFLLDKIPLINKLGWQTVLGASYLYTPDKGDYLELNVGIDNIGIKAFRLLRFDVVAPFVNGEFQELGFVIGLKI